MWPIFWDIIFVLSPRLFLLLHFFFQASSQTLYSLVSREVCGSEEVRRYPQGVSFPDFCFLDLGKVNQSEVAQSCPTLCDPMNYSLPGSSVHGIFQARILEWVAISYSMLLSFTPPNQEIKISLMPSLNPWTWMDFSNWSNNASFAFLAQGPHLPGI